MIKVLLIISISVTLWSDTIENNYFELKHKNAEPLGQEKRLDGSYPKEIRKKISDLNQSEYNNLIKRVQFALSLNGFYNTSITGKLDEETKKSIILFQNHNNLDMSSILNDETLTKLGVVLK